ncbi:Reverse transcriptase (RNA-dependent DNA polymerase) [Nesidiocoris tenuis]|nr:Reverse transcriptase (RNA-dependent DNA polymerase) [Nesidiocoris tenuis]
MPRRAEASASIVLPFQCLICQRSFTTPNGLGQHRKRTHPVEYNAELLTQPQTKRRYNAEERGIMAKEELKITLDRPGIQAKDIVSELNKLFPDRTAEAIRCQRKQAKYKELLADLMRESLLDREGLIFSTAPAADTDKQPQAHHTTEDDMVHLSDHETALPTTDVGEIQNKIAELCTKVTRHEKINGTRLQEIAQAALDGAYNEADLMKYVLDTFLPESTSQTSGTGGQPSGQRRQKTTPNSHQRKSQLRRAKYQRTQALWKKAPARVAEEILGEAEGSDGPRELALKDFEEYWTPLMSKKSIKVEPLKAVPEFAGKDLLQRIMESPVTAEETKYSKVPANTAPGPDGIQAKRWNAAPDEAKALIFNIFLLAKRTPTALTHTRTVFIPKKGGTGPEYHRPISVSSVIFRHWHKILAKRLASVEAVDARQRAFRRADGTAENLIILQAMIRHAKMTRKGLYMATLDVAKAFDTVSHKAIHECLKALGAPQNFVQYVKRLYKGNTTTFQVGGKSSAPVRVRRGVRQGDPLSPLLFNLVVDTALREIPGDIGFDIVEGGRVNALAFADDVVLVASSKVGLEQALKSFSAQLSRCGLEINPKKSATLSLVPCGRLKKTKVDSLAFQIQGHALQTLQIGDLWRYLGVEFQGVETMATSKLDLVQALAKIGKAPMKPQQRLRVLRVYLLPKLVYGLTFGRTTIGRLRLLDASVRAAVRKWLNLPHDTPIGYFHAKVKEGGLGISALSEAIPRQRRDRLTALQHSTWDVAQKIGSTQFVQAMLAWCNKFITEPQNGVSHYAKLLHESNDGYELRQSKDASVSTNWVSGKAEGIPGRDYVHYHNLRIGSLPTRVRTTRGREVRDAKCRACGANAETLAHIVQICPRTHGGRVLRHNAIVNTLEGALKTQGWKVETERPYTLPSGQVLKPDIVAARRGKAVIVDAQVVSGMADLRMPYNVKKGKYNREDLKVAVRQRFETVEDTEVIAATISWKGIWCGKSVRDLRALDVPLGVLNGITTRTLMGGYLNWWSFGRSTAVFPKTRTPNTPKDAMVGVG